MVSSLIRKAALAATLFLFGCGAAGPMPADQRVGDFSPSRLLPTTLGPNGYFLQSTGDAGVYQWAAINGGDPGTIVAPPLAASWSHLNFGGGTTLTNSGSTAFPTVYLSDFSGGGQNNSHAAYVATAGSTYTTIIAFRGNMSGTAGIAEMITDGTKLISFVFFTSGGVGQLEVYDAATATSSPTALQAQTATDISINARTWMRIKNDGANRHYQISSDGVNWLPDFFSHASGTFLTETGVGILIIPNSSNVGAGLILESFANTTP